MSASGSGTAINCISGGVFQPVIGTTYTSSAYTIYNGTRKNCYYLDGTEGTTGVTAKSGETKFYKTSTDPNAKTTASVVADLNSYIESNADSIDTNGWCKWVVGENNLPELDFNTTWSTSTSTWNTVSN